MMESMLMLLPEFIPVGKSVSTLVIMAVLYDAESHVMGFSEYYEPEPVEGLTEFPLEFDICIDVGDQNIARYEFRAWGQ